MEEFLKKFTIEKIIDRVKRRNQFKELENIVEETGSIFVTLRSDEYAWLLGKIKQLEEQ